jgi:Mn-dependent DtxR family transcriptional regulator
MAPCACCKGTGRVELSGVLMETYAALRAVNHELGTVELAERLDVSREVVLTRLRRLGELGLVADRREGKARLWRAVK